MHTQRCTCAHTHTCGTRTCRHIYTHTHIHTHTHMHTHTHSHTHTHTLAHTYTHTYTNKLILYTKHMALDIKKNAPSLTQNDHLHLELLQILENHFVGFHPVLKLLQHYHTYSNINTLTHHLIMSSPSYIDNTNH